MATQHSTQHGHRFIDLTGQVFGLWTVVGFHSTGKHGGSIWMCRCECGREKLVFGSNLRRGISAGCRSCRNARHGMYQSAEHSAWKGMRDRCSNKNSIGYDRYGGRGIKVCARWDVFENFLADMGPHPGRGYSIHRVDNDGDYTPENCIWATYGEQARNTSRSRFVSHGGRTLCIADWAHEVGMLPSTLYSRLMRGWPVEEALNTPVLFHAHYRKSANRKTC